MQLSVQLAREMDGIGAGLVIQGRDDVDRGARIGRARPCDHLPPPATRIDFTLIDGEASQHATQLLAGLALLAGQGRVELTVRDEPQLAEPAPSSRLARRRSALRAIVNGVRVVVDLDDSRGFDSELEAWSDVVFKRMVDPAALNDTVQTFGLNYPVAVRSSDEPADWRAPVALASIEELRGSRIAATDDWLAGPVVFLTRLWPAHEGRTPEDREWRQRICQFRIDLAGLLKARLGERGVVGIADDSFSRTCCPPELLVGADQTRKSAYLGLLARAAVVVCSLGLHRSIGWRMGEAVVLGVPIVAETGDAALPEPLAPHRHFVPFVDAAECVDAAASLAADPGRLMEIHQQQVAYYAEWLRPELLAWNLISKAINA